MRVDFVQCKSSAVLSSYLFSKAMCFTEVSFSLPFFFFFTRTSFNLFRWTVATVRVALLASSHFDFELRGNNGLYEER